MAFTQVQNKTAIALSSTTVAVTITTANLTAGNTILALVGGYATTETITGVSDGSNAFTQATSFFNGGAAGVYPIDLWYLNNIGGGNKPTITATFSATSTYGLLIVVEYSGIATSTPNDKGASSNGTSASASSGNTATTTQASELLIGGVVSTSNTAPTAGSGYGNLLSVGNSSVKMAIEDQTVSSTGAYAATFTVANTNWTCGIGTFKAPAGGAVAGLGFLTALGAGA